MDFAFCFFYYCNCACSKPVSLFCSKWWGLHRDIPEFLQRHLWIIPQTPFLTLLQSPPQEGLSSWSLHRISKAKVVYYEIVCKLLTTISKTKPLIACFILSLPIVFAHYKCWGIQTISVFGQWIFRLLNKRSSKIYLHQSQLYLPLPPNFSFLCSAWQDKHRTRNL